MFWASFQLLFYWKTRERWVACSGKAYESEQVNAGDISRFKRREMLSSSSTLNGLGSKLPHVPTHKVVMEVKNSLVVYIKEWVIIKLLLCRVFFGPVNCVNSENMRFSLLVRHVAEITQEARSKRLNDHEITSEVRYFPRNFLRRFLFRES